MKTAAILLLGIMLALGMAGMSSAFEIRKGDEVIVGADEVVADDLIAVGERVDIRGQVQGNLLAMGRSVKVAGAVSGVTVVLAQRARVKGDSPSSVFVGGQFVTVSGRAGRNLAAAGQDVTVEQDTRVGRDMALAGAQIESSGVVGRDLQVAAGSASLSGRVGRNAVIRSERCRLSNDAVIKGNLVFIGPSPTRAPSGGKVLGKIKQLTPTPGPVKEGRSGKPFFSLTFSLMGVVSIFLISLLMLMLLPGFTSQASGSIGNRPVSTLGFGALGFIVWPVAAVICMATVLALPLGMVLISLYGVTIFVAFSMAAIFLGGLILRHRRSPILAALVGAAVLGVLMLIPFINSLIFLAAVVFGLGGLMLTAGSIINRQRMVVQADQTSAS